LVGDWIASENSHRRNLDFSQTLKSLFGRIIGSVKLRSVPFLILMFVG
jgi:hypothetical protein